MDVTQRLTLDDEQLRQLVSGATDPQANEPFGAYVFAAGSPGAEIARHVERVVFLEAFGNTAGQLEVEYSPYESSSLLFCVVDHRRRVPAGALRIVVPAPGGPGLKSLNDVEPVWGEPAGALLARSGAEPPPEATWDIATLAVMPEYRGAAAAGLVSLALYQSVIGTAQRSGVDWLVAIVDVAVHRMSRLKFCEPFVPYAPGRSYLGSASSLPVYLHISDWQRRLELGDPAVHDIVFSARGIEAAVRPVDVDGAVFLAGSVSGELGAASLGQEWTEPTEIRSRQATALPPGTSALAG